MQDVHDDNHRRKRDGVRYKYRLLQISTLYVLHLLMEIRGRCMVAWAYIQLVAIPPSPYVLRLAVCSLSIGETGQKFNPTIGCYNAATVASVLSLAAS